jgi:uncharacterized membrane protein
MKSRRITEEKPAPSPRPPRLVPLDALRGLIMVLMALDHANYFVARGHPSGEFWGVPIPQYSDPAGFLTRFVPHICAPGFFFLMGAGMVLFAHSRRSMGWAEGRISRHLFSRGLILIALQFLLENSAWVLGPVYTFRPPGTGNVVWVFFGVLFGLGATMFIGTFFLRTKPVILAGLSALVIIGSAFLVPDAGQAARAYSPFLRILFIPGRTGIVQVFYPILPWLGIVLLGCLFGRWLLRDRGAAFRWASPIGGAFLAVFLILRKAGGFGNIHAPEGSSLISFLNVTKYPPSLAFTFLTLGLCLFLIGIFSRVSSSLERRGKPLLVYGRSPLFFYVLHLYFFALIGLVFASRGGSGLAVMYPIWLAVLIPLYFLCRWYGDFKRIKPAGSIWKFF